MGSVMIVILSPGFYSLPGVFDRFELVHVQALIAQPTVEGLDESVLRRLPGPDEVELDAVVPRPLIQRL